MNSELIRKDFPILETKVNGHPVVYFDNGATTQRPLPVMRAVMDYVTRNNGNPHRGAHIFAMSASEAYDTSKTVVKDFIGAKSEKEIIYTRNTSESLNLVARSYGETHLKEGDRILATDIHIQMVPSPGGPIPTPLPSPFVGTIDGGLSSDVHIEGKAAATKDSTATNTPSHIPTAGPFQKSPSNSATILAGSATVQINGKAAARMGDMAQTCNDPADLPAGTVIASGTVLIG